MFESADKLILGLITGILFGVLLQKGRVAKFEVIVGQFLLRDWTVAKIMFTAIAVGSLGVYALVSLGLATLHIKTAVLGGILLGGVLFGIGLAVLGYCPGTTVAACGEGHRDAVAGFAGLLFGAAVYVWAFPAWQTIAKLWGDRGKITLPAVTATPPWVWVVGLLAAVLLFRAVVRRFERTAAR